MGHLYFCETAWKTSSILKRSARDKTSKNNFPTNTHKKQQLRLNVTILKRSTHVHQALESSFHFVLLECILEAIRRFTLFVRKNTAVQSSPLSRFVRCADHNTCQRGLCSSSLHSLFCRRCKQHSAQETIPGIRASHGTATQKKKEPAQSRIAVASARISRI